jgi:enolase-phosphatase E1
MLTPVITDVEGTTTPISFVRDTLFPFAVANLDAFVDNSERDPEKREKLDQHISAFRQVSSG